MEFEKLCSIIAEVLDIEPGEIEEKTAFVDDLGANSLDLLEILIKVEGTFDVEIENEMADGVETVGEVAEVIRRAVR